MQYDSITSSIAEALRHPHYRQPEFPFDINPTCINSTSYQIRDGT
ncbi:hypothetical protein AZE42_09104 [Rhizopogon vesiculosus]|uniref:Uncharacterized protein n=1 Tax=Rhizopogon vesiculosus TaxID=180088 RepID=A0A1J8PV87_9AGAM|nr:hypothetical protein AZE42_09104 [Rhizopogon vesiculosus]